MKHIIAILLFALPAVAEELDPMSESCAAGGLYALFAVNCPQFSPTADLTLPLCEQPGLEKYSYLDFRCYEEVYRHDKECTAWDCPTPYDHLYVEPRSGRTKQIREDSTGIDAAYRSLRQEIGKNRSRWRSVLKERRARK